MDAVRGSVRCPIVVGRDDLLDLADRRFDDAEVGRGQFLLLAGVAGIGKTRLLRAIAHKALERGFVDSYGHLAPQDIELPGGAVLDQARSMRSIPSLATSGAAILELLGSAPSANRTGRRRLALDIVDAFLAAPDEPTLYGFEDLQWADDLSLDVIAELARRSRDRHMLIAATYRTEETGSGSSLREWRSRLVTQRIAEELRLGPLSRDETALVATLILDSGLPAPKDVATVVYARTDGVPLYIEELLGAVGPDARSSGKAIRDAIVPDTIEDAVLRRLSRCSPEAQAAAEAGAVIGRCFTVEVLAGVMDLPQDVLDGPLQELVDQFLVTPPFDEVYFDFPHQLLREAIYRSVKVGDRRRYHGRAGRFGARLVGQSEIHASAHFERAGMAREAYETALVGAREAGRMSLHREGFDLYRRAVANLPDDLGSAERAAILEAYAEEALATERLDLAEGAATSAAEAYEAVGDRVSTIRATALAQVVARRQGVPLDDRIAAKRQLIEEIDAVGSPDEMGDIRVEAVMDLAKYLMDARRIDEAAPLLDALRVHAEQVGDPELLMAVDWKVGVAEMIRGETGAGLRRITTAAETAERAGWEGLGISAYRDAAAYAMEAMDYAASQRWADAGLRYADSIQQSYCANIMGATSAMVAWAAGAWPEADQLAHEKIRDEGSKRSVAMARWAAGYVALGRGDLSGATAELELALRFGEASQEIDLILIPLWGLAEVALLDGDPELAFTRCREAFERARASGERVHLAPFVVTGVRSALAAGRPTEAADWYRSCVEVLAPILAVADAALEHGRGLLALADGATGVAKTALTAAIARWDAHGRTWEAAWGRLDLASCLIRSNRFADGLGLATEVRDLAAHLDCRALADRADALIRMARGHVPTDEPWRPLTAREFGVARLIAEGRTNAEIAAELGIAPKTASAHVEHILAKLGVARRAEIAAWATSVERSAATEPSRRERHALAN